MPTWVCPKCSEAISSAFDRNLALLVNDHKSEECKARNLPPDKLLLTRQDMEFLVAAGISWED